MIVLIWAAVLIAAVYFYLRDVYSVLEKYGVKHLKPVPLLGNMLPIIRRKNHMGEQMQELYNTFREER